MKIFCNKSTCILLSRLGLIPLRADPRLFEYPPNNGRVDDEVSDQDTLRYELKVMCSVNPQAPKNSRLPEDMYRNSKGTSLDLLLLNFRLLSRLYNNFGLIYFVS